MLPQRQTTKPPALQAASAKTQVSATPAEVAIKPISAVAATAVSAVDGAMRTTRVAKPVPSPPSALARARLVEAVVSVEAVLEVVSKQPSLRARVAEPVTPVGRPVDIVTLASRRLADGPPAPLGHKTTPLPATAVPAASFRDGLSRRLLELLVVVALPGGAVQAERAPVAAPV